MKTYQIIKSDKSYTQSRWGGMIFTDEDIKKVLEDDRVEAQVGNELLVLLNKWYKQVHLELKGEEI